MKPILSPYLNAAGQRVPDKRNIQAGDLSLTLELRGNLWWTRFQINGRRHNINTHTADEVRAARKAVQTYTDILRGKPCSHTVPTLGQIIELWQEDQKEHVAPSTLNAYPSRLRTVVRTGLGLSDDYPVDGLSSELLDAELVSSFLKARVAGAKRGEEAECRKRGANSIMGDARAIFKRHLLARGLYTNLPDISGFMNAPLFKAMPVAYKYEQAEAHINRIIANLPELKEKDPAAYLLFKLSATCGLRMAEAMHGRKEWISTFKGKRVIHVQATEEWIPKGRKARRVPLSDEMYAELLTLGDDTEFLVPTSKDGWYWTEPFLNSRGTLVKGAWRKARGSSTSTYERRKGVSRRLSKWFTRHGWPFSKKAHELRKWFGAQVASQTGSLFATQRLLGHADVKTTDSYYADLVNLPEIEISLGGTANVQPACDPVHEPSQQQARLL